MTVAPPPTLSDAPVNNAAYAFLIAVSGWFEFAATGASMTGLPPALFTVGHADHLRAWLYRVTTTAAIDAHRARRRELPTDDVPAAATHDHYDEGAFESLIAPLPDGARIALRLRFVDDLDYEGIADRLGISAVAARQRVSTAVRTLRERLAA